MGQSVFVDWNNIGPDEDEGWEQKRCLYAYMADNGELLYIGKSWGKTVRQRWGRCAKEDFWRDLERERNIFRHAIVVGTIALYPGNRLTHLLLTDVESLLIHRTQPWGNIQARASRISRPGLVVHCRGDWQERQRRFHDH